jgi:hypothetical protein
MQPDHMFYHTHKKYKFLVSSKPARLVSLNETVFGLCLVPIPIVLVDVVDLF